MPSFRFLIPALFALALCGAPMSASAQSFNDSQRGDIETMACAGAGDEITLQIWRNKKVLELKLRSIDRMDYLRPWSVSTCTSIRSPRGR